MSGTPTNASDNQSLLTNTTTHLPTRSTDNCEDLDSYLNLLNFPSLLSTPEEDFLFSNPAPPAPSKPVHSQIIAQKQAAKRPIIQDDDSEDDDSVDDAQENAVSKATFSDSDEETPRPPIKKKAKPKSIPSDPGVRFSTDVNQWNLIQTDEGFNIIYWATDEEHGLVSVQFNSLEKKLSETLRRQRGLKEFNLYYLPDSPSPDSPFHHALILTLSLTGKTPKATHDLLTTFIQKYLTLTLQIDPETSETVQGYLEQKYKELTAPKTKTVDLGVHPIPPISHATLAPEIITQLTDQITTAVLARLPASITTKQIRILDDDSDSADKEAPKPSHASSSSDQHKISTTKVVIEEMRDFKTHGNNWIPYKGGLRFHSKQADKKIRGAIAKRYSTYLKKMGIPQDQAIKISFEKAIQSIVFMNLNAANLPHLAYLLAPFGASPDQLMNLTHQLEQKRQQTLAASITEVDGTEKALHSVDEDDDASDLLTTTPHRNLSESASNLAIKRICDLRESGSAWSFNLTDGSFHVKMNSSEEAKFAQTMLVRRYRRSLKKPSDASTEAKNDTASIVISVLNDNLIFHNLRPENLSLLTDVILRTPTLSYASGSSDLTSYDPTIALTKFLATQMRTANREYDVVSDVLSPNLALQKTMFQLMVQTSLPARESSRQPSRWEISFQPETAELQLICWLTTEENSSILFRKTQQLRKTTAFKLYLTTTAPFLALQRTYQKLAITTANIRHPAYANLTSRIQFNYIPPEADFLKTPSNLKKFIETLINSIAGKSLASFPTEAENLKNHLIRAVQTKLTSSESLELIGPTDLAIADDDAQYLQKTQAIIKKPTNWGVQLSTSSDVEARRQITLIRWFHPQEAWYIPQLKRNNLVNWAQHTADRFRHKKHHIDTRYHGCKITYPTHQERYSPDRHRIEIVGLSYPADQSTSKEAASDFLRPIIQILFCKAGNFSKNKPSELPIDLLDHLAELLSQAVSNDTHSAGVVSKTALLTPPSLTTVTPAIASTAPITSEAPDDASAKKGRAINLLLAQMFNLKEHRDQWSFHEGVLYFQPLLNDESLKTANLFDLLDNRYKLHLKRNPQDKPIDSKKIVIFHDRSNKITFSNLSSKNIELFLNVILYRPSTKTLSSSQRVDQLQALKLFLIDELKIFQEGPRREVVSGIINASRFQKKCYATLLSFPQDRWEILRNPDKETLSLACQFSKDEIEMVEYGERTLPNIIAFSIAMNSRKAVKIFIKDHFHTALTLTTQKHPDNTIEFKLSNVPLSIDLNTLQGLVDVLCPKIEKFKLDDRQKFANQLFALIQTHKTSASSASRTISDMPSNTTKPRPTKKSKTDETSAPADPVIKTKTERWQVIAKNTDSSAHLMIQVQYHLKKSFKDSWIASLNEKLAAAFLTPEQKALVERYHVGSYEVFTEKNKSTSTDAAIRYRHSLIFKIHCNPTFFTTKAFSKLLQSYLTNVLVLPNEKKVETLISDLKAKFTQATALAFGRPTAEPTAVTTATLPAAATV